MSMAEPSSIQAEKEARAIKKVSRRFLWFLFILMTINYMDRSNVGFAALTMNKDLGISAAMFGTSIAVFSTFYFICEIPSNLIMARVGARRWLARIMVTWGIASVGCMFVVGAWSLLGARALVGIAEAGFAPGLVLYLTYWFPQYYRARANASFMISQPVANMTGAMISGVILGMNGFLGIAGWRWLFLIEGLPAVIFGIIAWFYLTDRPRDAKWLTDEEKRTLQAAIDVDAAKRDKVAAAGPKRSVTRHLLSRNNLLLSVSFGTMIASFSALANWLPQILRGVTRPDMPYWEIGLLTAIPFACTLIALPLWAMWSDRTEERYWNCIIPILCGAGFWVAAALVGNPAWQLAALTAASVCVTPVWPIMFTLPAMVLPREAHPAGIAFINVVGIMGATLSPLIMGIMRDLTGAFTAPMIVIGALLAIGAGLMMLVPRKLIVGEPDAPALIEAVPEVATAT
jgi:ACS family 4-hydroxyphenylacetate permease-like MFS transporter